MTRTLLRLLTVGFFIYGLASGMAFSFYADHVAKMAESRGYSLALSGLSLRGLTEVRIDEDDEDLTKGNRPHQEI